MKLEYLHGQVVKNVLTKKDESGWLIEFDSGALISNEDGEIEAPVGIVGKSFLTTLFSEDSTRLHFGVVTNGQITDDEIVTLGLDTYTMTDPRFEGVHRPTSGYKEDAEAQAATIREQFNALSDRAAEGPEEQDDEQG